MTDSKKTAKDKSGGKRKKLTLNKVTLKDLKTKHAGPKGGGGICSGRPLC